MIDLFMNVIMNVSLPIGLMIIVTMVVRGTIMSRRIHEQIVQAREAELRFHVEKNHRLSLSIAAMTDFQRTLTQSPPLIDYRVPSRPRSKQPEQATVIPYGPLTPLQRDELRAFVGPRMPCQGVTIPGHAAIEWDTSYGIKTCAKALGARVGHKALSTPKRQSDCSDEEYEWVEVTTFGDPEPSFVRGRRIPMRPDPRLSNPQLRMSPPPAPIDSNPNVWIR